MSDIIIPDSRKEWEIYRDALPLFWDRSRVPSISGVLGWKLGFPPDFDHIKVAMDRGKKTHHALQLKDEGKLTRWRTVDHADLLGYLEQWDAFIEPQDVFLAIEKPLYARLCDLDYLAKPDRVFRRRSAVYLVDIKTKSKMGRKPTQEEHLKNALQLAAQSVAVMQRMGITPDWVGCAYLWPDHREIVGYNHPRFLDKWGEILGEWGDAYLTQQAAGA